MRRLIAEESAGGTVIAARTHFDGTADVDVAYRIDFEISKLFVVWAAAGHSADCWHSSSPGDGTFVVSVVRISQECRGVAPVQRAAPVADKLLQLFQALSHSLSTSLLLLKERFGPLEV